MHDPAAAVATHRSLEREALECLAHGRPADAERVGELDLDQALVAAAGDRAAMSTRTWSSDLPPIVFPGQPPSGIQHCIPSCMLPDSPGERAAMLWRGGRCRGGGARCSDRGCRLRRRHVGRNTGSSSSAAAKTTPIRIGFSTWNGYIGNRREWDGDRRPRSAQGARRRGRTARQLRHGLARPESYARCWHACPRRADLPRSTPAAGNVGRRWAGTLDGYCRGQPDPRRRQRDGESRR